MNEIDKARLEVRDAMKHLFNVICDALPGDLDKEDKIMAAEHTMDHIVDAECILVQNKLT